MGNEVVWRWSPVPVVIAACISANKQKGLPACSAAASAVMAFYFTPISPSRTYESKYSKAIRTKMRHINPCNPFGRFEGGGTRVVSVGRNRKRKYFLFFRCAWGLVLKYGKLLHLGLGL